jgi:Arc/MetJ-type ribon-helix-helix transcriptional regulator
VPGGRSKTRITVAVEPALVRALDGQAKSRGITRSAAVEEALSEWLRQRMEEDSETLDRLEGRNGSAERNGADEAEIAARMVLEAMRYQFPAMREVTDEDLRRWAMEATTEARRSQRRNGSGA